jgi:predicted KAP-like P-loop ATPase
LRFYPPLVSEACNVDCREAGMGPEALEDWDDKSAHPFSADRPIQTRAQDLLGRTNFADALADAISGWTHGDSLVVALYGPWGMGKSSIKNMALDRLSELPLATKPTVVEFNPWEWSAQEHVASAFFRAIEAALGRQDKTRNSRERAAKWRAYGASLQVGSSALRGLRAVLAASALLVAVLGFGGAIPQSGALRSIFLVIGALGLLATALFTLGGKTAESIALAITAAAEARSRPLADLKRDLAGLLAELTRPILVVIDDIDRLAPEEIRLVFQLLKANGDFPNLVYLLLFDPAYVDSSLRRVGIDSPGDFREKVVQVGFDVPAPEKSRVHGALFEGLDQIIGDEVVGERFDRQRWARLFVPGLSLYFENLRDVRRFLGMISFHVSLLKGDTAFEVNPVDLIALETLRVFEPSLYKKLPDVKSVLTRGVSVGSSFGSGNSQVEEERRRILALADMGQEDRVDGLKVILRELFPPAAWALGGANYGDGFDEEWLRDLRACAPIIFDRYFLLAIPEGDISQGDLDRIRSLAGDRDGLAGVLRDLNERRLLGVALERLEAYKQTIDIQYAVPFVTALLDVSDELPEGESGFFSINADAHAGRIVHWYLKQEPDPAKRASILTEAIRATTGLFLPVREVSLQKRQPEKTRDEDLYLVTETDLVGLQTLCVEKIRDAADAGQLQTLSRMKYVLYRWREWASEEALHWVEALITTREGLLAFLGGSLGKRTSLGMGNYLADEDWRIDPKEITDFISLDQVSEQVQKLDIESLTDVERGAVAAFEAALAHEGSAGNDT